MIELMMLGFLAERPHHGYDLRQRMNALHGYARTVSEGALYPAVSRQSDRGYIAVNEVDGEAGPKRRMLSLTQAGHDRLEERLRDASGFDITDGQRFLVVLTFLSKLPSESDREQVLRRRLDFLDQPVAFQFEDGRPVRKKDETDPYRRGVLTVAGATRNAEIAWLRQQLEVGEP
ncbi:PadR family transcriptional regulator [Brevibacterium sp. ZH18]|uniref:PadR family transcriptional regulator n=1 Tax=Brevibacterium sp. ZH18 TaxID=2927784 RepID=UPI001F60C764|nr:PadR family transcriptional regulator [Brevibacterium sp. ZH18]MCI4011497.1 PadR family transcriptional regulator [Brevibacterium sp. ZH18]